LFFRLSLSRFIISNLALPSRAPFTFNLILHCTCVCGWLAPRHVSMNITFLFITLSFRSLCMQVQHPPARTTLTQICNDYRHLVSFRCLIMWWWRWRRLGTSGRRWVWMWTASTPRLRITLRCRSTPCTSSEKWRRRF
jgi:hypothetical protein